MSTLYELVATITCRHNPNPNPNPTYRDTRVRNWKVWFNDVTVLYRGALPLCSTHYAPGHNIKMLELGLGFLLCRKYSICFYVVLYDNPLP